MRIKVLRIDIFLRIKVFLSLQSSSSPSSLQKRYMERLLTEKLIAWKSQSSRKPVLLDGARQVGKSYLVEHLFGKRCFAQVHKLDFMQEPGLAELFADGLNPKSFISKLEIRRNTGVNLAKDLIFFDEIGECQSAVDSLKYFAEELPQAFVCASGSSIGLLGSFPVGKVEFMELFPMTFEEFVMADGNRGLIEAFREQRRNAQVHSSLWSMLLDYYFVGGMPEAVQAWFDGKGELLERCERVTRIHDALIAGYQVDFGKYSGKVHAGHLQSVFRNIPRQLSKNLDGSVQRFLFKGVVERKKRYAELRGPIDWLEKAKLASKCHTLDCRPAPPLSALAKDNMFKLFVFDLGILSRLLDMGYAEHQAQKIAYKGFIAENFVQNELRAQGRYPTYAWQQARSEVECLLKTKNGEIIPVEVKSGERTRAKSLRSYIERYAPSRALKLIGGYSADAGDRGTMVWPLYDAGFLHRL